MLSSGPMKMLVAVQMGGERHALLSDLPQTSASAEYLESAAVGEDGAVPAS